jgi:hypothetical protein
MTLAHWAPPACVQSRLQYPPASQWDVNECVSDVLSGASSCIEGMEQCMPLMAFSPWLAASACETVGASVAIRIANDPNMLPIFSVKTPGRVPEAKRNATTRLCHSDEAI